MAQTLRHAAQNNFQFWNLKEAKRLNISVLLYLKLMVQKMQVYFQLLDYLYVSQL